MKKIILVCLVFVGFILLLFNGWQDMEVLNQLQWEEIIGEIYGETKVGQSFTSHLNGLNKISVKMANFRRLNTHDVIFHLKINPDEENLPKEFAGPPVGEIYGETKVGQSFYSYGSGLSGIKVLMANYHNRENTHNVIFHLMENPKSTKDFRRVVVNASEILDNEYHNFEFNPIPDSKGKTYYFYIESPDSVPGNAITVLYAPDDIYGGGTRFMNSKPVKGDLFFQKINPNDLFKISVNASKIGDMKFHDFIFSPILDSKGVSYYFYLESPASVHKNAVTAYYSKVHDYPEGRMFTNGLPAEGDLSFRTCYKTSFKGIVKPFIHHILKDKSFAVFYLILFCLTFILWIKIVLKRQRISKKGKN